MKKIFKRWWFLVLVLALFCMQSLNHTGFCYSEGRYLSENELIDRYLFGPDAKQMSQEEKTEASKNREYPTGIGEIAYPECCSAKDGHFLNNKVSHFLNRTFLGKYLFEVTAYFPVKGKELSSEYHYIEIITHVDACGRSISGDSLAIGLNEGQYKNALKRNQQVHHLLERFLNIFH
ncbi:MAG: hypothetical protein AB7E85_02500 [Pseudobdellovibrionaceae bacterium]